MSINNPGTGNISPTPDPGAGVTPSATAVAASNIVLKAGAGNLYGITLNTVAVAGYLMIFDATAKPADGVVTPAYCIGVLPTNSAYREGFDPPLKFATGITAVFSSTGPFTLTASATAFIEGEAV